MENNNVENWEKLFRKLNFEWIELIGNDIMQFEQILRKNEHIFSNKKNKKEVESLKESLILLKEQQ